MNLISTSDQSQSKLSVGARRARKMVAFTSVQHRWEERLNNTAVCARARALLAVRRAIYKMHDQGMCNGMGQIREQEARDWIHLVVSATRLGSAMASAAVTHTMLLDDGNAVIEKAKFYRD